MCACLTTQGPEEENGTPNILDYFDLNFHPPGVLGAGADSGGMKGAGSASGHTPPALWGQKTFAFKTHQRNTSTKRCKLNGTHLKGKTSKWLKSGAWGWNLWTSACISAEMEVLMTKERMPSIQLEPRMRRSLWPISADRPSDPGDWEWSPDQRILRGDTWCGLHFSYQLMSTLSENQVLFC